jgi:hypothetical protein
MLIGVIGFAGSGKGTVADILVRDHDFHKLSFADALKDSVATIFGWERRLLEGDTDESRKFRETIDPWWSKRFAYDVTPRYMLQLMGTEAGRNAFHIDIWIHTVARRMMQFENVVIADARFPNELQFIRDNGGFNVHVERGNNPEWYEIARQANKEHKMNLMMGYPTHYSEWAWIGEKFNYLLTNNGSLAMLEADVKHMLRVQSGPAIIELHSEK